MLYGVTLKSSCLLSFAWTFSSFLCFSCAADGILKSEKTSSECEQQTLQAMDPSMCGNIGAPQILAIALQIIDCRLYLLGKPPLHCSYLRQRDSFTCKYPVGEMMANEILLTLLDIFERCHSTFANHFATETSLLLQKLSSSAETAEEVNMKLIKSKHPLELIRQVHRIQEDAHLVEAVVLKKAYALNKKVAKVRRVISNHPLRLNFTKTIEDNLWQFENCYSNPTDAEGIGRLRSECFINSGFCFRQGQVEWVFSVLCSTLFLVMIYKIERSQEHAFSVLVRLLLFAVRAYSQSQNYTTFLEQFFLETVLGFSLVAIFSMATGNVRS